MTEAPAHRDVRFEEALRLYVRNFAMFEGRSSRGAIWWPFLVWLLVACGLGTVDYGILGGGLSGYKVLTTLFSLATLIPNISVGMRRLHDIDKSGWWLLFMLVPAVGWFIVLMLFCMPGTRGANRFGPDVEAGR